MPASASYLTKYLSASNSSKPPNDSPDFEDSNRPKKRRKKDKSGTTAGNGTLLIADDDEGLLLSGISKTRHEDEDDDPLVYQTSIRDVEFRKKKTSAWKSVGDGDIPGPKISATNGSESTTIPRTGQNGHEEEDEKDQDDATKILAAMAHESTRRTADIDTEDQPTIVDSIPTTTPIIMSSGAPAGLQTASDTAALHAAAAASATTTTAKPPSKSKRKSHSQPQEQEQEQETIYRDASGRRIDVSLARAEARAAATAKQLAERQDRDDAMGEVQVAAREKGKRELEEARYLTLGRDADDEEMNVGLRGVVRWDDPMAGYMAERAREKGVSGTGDEGGEGGVVGGNGERRGTRGGEGKGKVGGRREYMGAAPPNRYGVRPGWRWDGVDRGNGFEKEWFQARGKKTRNENLEYQWAYDE